MRHDAGKRGTAVKKRSPTMRLGERVQRSALGMARFAARAAGRSEEAAALTAPGIVQGVLRPFQRRRRPPLDLCLVVKDGSRGWILEAVCREIAAHFDGRWEICGRLDRVPRARGIFFVHYHFYLAALKNNPHLWDSRCAVWVTHPKEEARDFSGPAVIRALSRTTVVSMCSMWRDLLERLGVPRERLRVSLAGADPGLFPGHVRGGGRVGLCAAYYDRKSPERIMELVRAMPHRSFTLMGRGWDACPGFADLLRLPNFEYRQGCYADYPAFYRELDVFVSLAALEGGPVPLVEAMMSNVVPVATRTGFAPDLIRDGDNGFLCDIDAPASAVAALVERAFGSTADVRRTVEHLTWRRFSERIQEAALGEPAAGRSAA
jgi:glycosyltransferase involved in cell wall biosynthesis